MRPLFVHPNFPAQFGHVAHYASAKLGWPCVFLTSVDTSAVQAPFTHINYRLKDDVPCPPQFTNPESLGGLMEHLGAIYRGVRGLPELQPDLVVGHLSYGTLLYLRDLYPVPFVGLFEIYPGPFWGDGMVLRKEFPPPEPVRLFHSTYHALTLMQLHAVDVAYAPSRAQRDMAPAELRDKIRVMPEGVDCQLFQPRPRPAADEWGVGPSTKVVTYVSRGLESVRGFDVFMKVAAKVAAARADVRFVVAGLERSNYGHELAHTGGQSFKQWVLSRGDYDLSRFGFVGLPGPEALAKVYNLSDLHIHLSVPYVPSPSLLQAMASGCAVLGSATSPVQEYVEHGRTGRLVGFDDVDGLAAAALELLDAPDKAKRLGREARLQALEEYELWGCTQRLCDFFAEFGGRDAAIDSVMSGLSPK